MTPYKALTMGRPKGSKSVGIPQRTIEECVGYVSAAYEKIGDKTMTFDEMRVSMNVSRGACKAASGALAQYGLAEKKYRGWSLTDLGKRAAKKENLAIKAAFERISIYKDLSSHFWDTETTPGIIEQHIKSRYKKGEYAKEIVNRFLDAKIFILNLESKPSEEIPPSVAPDLEMCAISRRVGQLFPPENKGKAIEVLKELIKLSERRNLNKFAGFIQGLKVGFENRDLSDKQIFDELQNASSTAIDYFESDSGIKAEKTRATEKK